MGAVEDQTVPGRDDDPVARIEGDGWVRAGDLERAFRQFAASNGDKERAIELDRIVRMPE